MRHSPGNPGVPPVAAPDRAGGPPASLSREQALALLDAGFRAAGVGLAFVDRGLSDVRSNSALAAMTARLDGAPIRRVFESGQPITGVELSLVPPGSAGPPIAAIASFYPVPGTGGGVEWVALVVTHAGESRPAPVASGRAGEGDRALAHAVPALLYGTAADGVCDSVNEFWRDFTGSAEAVAMGEGWLDAVHPDDRERTRARWMESVTTGAGFETEFRLRRRDGVYRWFRAQAMPVRGAGGSILRWSGIGVDVHDRREAEEAVRRSQKLESIGVVAGGIAHDFNNLLTGILGNASLALRSLPKGTPVAEMIADVVRASERAAGLTSQLLAYAGKGRFTVVPVDLGRLVRELTELLRASLPKKVVVALEVEARLPPVEADPSQLQQVVMNLVINGAEAIGDESGTVRVRVSGGRIEAEEIAARFRGFELAAGRCLRVEVDDTGCGMDPETMARIFEPFFSTKFVGRGLGLAATLGIVRAHHGGIAVESTPGRGTRFTLVLPALSSGGPPESPPPAPARRGGQELVLVVDDEALVRRAARVALEDVGYRVVEAEDGVEALELFRRSPDEIAVVLLDMTMPVMGGDEAVRHIRRTHPGTRIIASSGYGELETIRRFAGAGVTAYLQKPYASEQLVELVGRLLKPAAL